MIDKALLYAFYYGYVEAPGPLFYDIGLTLDV